MYVREHVYNEETVKAGKKVVDVKHLENSC